MPAEDLADLTARTTKLLAELTHRDSHHPQAEIKHLPGLHRLQGR
jgi:hypothetical protein